MNQLPLVSPLVSIALCTCNGARYLPQQLDSLLAQTHRRFELVARDDASDDETWDVLQAYAPRFEGGATLLRNPQRLGINANFEQAFQACRGDWIAPCDQDDVWHKHKLAGLLQAAEGGASLVYGDSAFVDSQGRPSGARVSGQRRMVEGRQPLAFVFSNCVSGHAMIFRRELLQRALPLPEEPCYDWWLAFVASSLDSIAYVDEPLVEFRRHEATATGLGHARRSRPSPLARDAEVARRLAAFASLPSPSQAVFVQLARLWSERATRATVPALAKFCWQHHAALTRLEVHPSSRVALASKFFWGLSLKQSLWQWLNRSGD